jgi:hypothetical protein
MVVCEKKTAVGDAELQEGLGEKWIWTAIDTPSRLIVNFHVAGHTLEDAREMLVPLTNSIDRDVLPLFVSDELVH